MSEVVRSAHYEVEMLTGLTTLESSVQLLSSEQTSN